MFIFFFKNNYIYLILMKKILISALFFIIIGTTLSSCKLLNKDCDCPPTPAKIPLKILK